MGVRNFEHKILEIVLDTESGEIEDLLDTLGMDGWSLLAVTDQRWIFRRPFVVGRVDGQGVSPTEE